MTDLMERLRPVGSGAVWCRHCNLFRHDIGEGDGCPNCGQPMISDDPRVWEGDLGAGLGPGTITCTTSYHPEDRVWVDWLERAAGVPAGGVAMVDGAGRSWLGVWVQVRRWLVVLCRRARSGWYVGVVGLDVPARSVTSAARYRRMIEAEAHVHTIIT